jgi:hypothetical protein
MSPAVLSFFATDFDESVRLSVLGPTDGWGVERPDALSSDALPLLEGADAPFSFAPSFAADVVAGFVTGFAAGFVTGFATGFADGFEVNAAAGEAYFAVLLYGSISMVFG